MEVFLERRLSRCFVKAILSVSGEVGVVCSRLNGSGPVVAFAMMV